MLLAAAPGAAAQSSSTAPQFACGFANAPTDCGFAEQAYALPRATIINALARDGLTAVRLHTEPGDNNVAGSGTAERDDLVLAPSASYCNQGQEEWWAHSILFPGDYVDPPQSTDTTWNWATVFDFHNSAPGGGQANFQINAMPATALYSDRPTGLNFQIAYGDQSTPTVYSAPIGPVLRNVWYDFVYHVKWSSATDGYFTAWVNGVQKMDYHGPTLYAGQSCYLKLANYHTPFGQASSVIHDRVLRGSTQDSVALALADTTPPIVSLTSPLAGATISGTVTLTAVASDDVGVAGVQFKYNGINIGPEQTTAPYAIAADTTTVSNGSYTLTAVARDAASNVTTSAPVTVTVSNGLISPGDATPPTVNLTSPTAGTTVSGAITLAASASDNVGVAGVQFQLDGVSVGAEVTASPYFLSWSTTATSNGTHNLTAVARDAAGNRTTSARVGVTVLNDTTPPVVSLTSPKAGAIASRVITLTAIASDNVGVSGVQFQLDGASLGAEIAAAPYSLSWSTTAASNGAHNLSAVARDAAGNRTTSAQVSVTVLNKVSSDFNGDGKSDILWRDSVTGQSAIWFMNGGTVASSPFIATVSDLNWKIAGTGDFDGDGDADILWRNNSTGQNQIWLMKGATISAALNVAGNTAAAWKIAGIADFDGDGKADILWRNGNSGQNQLWLMNGAAIASNLSLPKVSDQHWTVAALGDFDGNKRTEILWRNNATGENQIWFMNGAAIASAPSINAVTDLNWAVAGAGDFDGDGKSDVLWRNTATGENAIFFMNGSTVLSTTFITQVSDLSWTIAGIGDFDGDGKSDILWRNSSTNQDGIFFMSAGTVTSTVFLANIPAEWSIALR